MYYNIIFAFLLEMYLSETISYNMLIDATDSPLPKLN